MVVKSIKFRPEKEVLKEYVDHYKKVLDRYKRKRNYKLCPNCKARFYCGVMMIANPNGSRPHWHFERGDCYKCGKLIYLRVEKDGSWNIINKR